MLERLKEAGKNIRKLGEHVERSCLLYRRRPYLYETKRTQQNTEKVDKNIDMEMI